MCRCRGGTPRPPSRRRSAHRLSSSVPQTMRGKAARMASSRRLESSRMLFYAAPLGDMPHHQDRAMSMADHRVRDAAHQSPPNAAQPSAAHGDQANAQLLG